MSFKILSSNPPRKALNVAQSQKEAIEILMKPLKNQAQPADPSRKLAVDAILQVWRGEKSLTPEIFEGAPHELAARAMRLARETLRHETGFEKIIDKLSKNKPKPAVKALLYLACFEILVEGIAGYGVVHDVVELTKSQNSTKNAVGFVNAILRQISEIKYKGEGANSFSPELHQHLRKQYAKKHIVDMNKAQLEMPGLDLRLKDPATKAEWLEKLNAKDLDPVGAIRLSGYEQISELDGFSTGDWWVQDAAATIAVDCFSDLKGKLALDMCAAPGGKSMQLASLGAIVTSVEISKERANRITQNLERTGLSAELVIADGLEFDRTDFDMILLDAPCSATGTLRRHPDLKYGEPLERMYSLAPLQYDLLCHAFSLLKIGGELIYVTCSLLFEEGERQIEKFLSNTPNAKLIPLDPVKFGLKAEFAPYIRSFPTIADDQWNMDGFFIAKLCKSTN